MLTWTILFLWLICFGIISVICTDSYRVISLCIALVFSFVIILVFVSTVDSSVAEYELIDTKREITLQIGYLKSAKKDTIEYSIEVSKLVSNVEKYNVMVSKIGTNNKNHTNPFYVHWSRAISADKYLKMDIVELMEVVR